MKTLRRLNKNKKGVSQVIAVLVLTAVVIVGAIGAGMIMNTFSNQVSKSTSAEGIGTGAATELLIAGSTTVQPLSECLAKEYMEANKGVRVTVQGGGSDAGIASTGMDIVDLGSASKVLTQANLDKYPNLQQFEVAGSAVVLIASTACGTPTDKATALEVNGCYNNSAAGCTIAGLPNAVLNAYQRAEGSGTEETFAKWVGYQDSTTKQLKSDSAAIAVNGNAGVLSAVSSATTCVIGFVDFGFANGVSAVKMVNVTDSKSAGEYAPTSANIKDALKNLAGKYPNDAAGLTRPLTYLTNGAPSSMEQAFITFASSPASEKCVRETGVFAVWEYAI